MTNRRILFVDDEERVLQAFERNLSDEFAVFTAGGGASGLEAIRTEPPFAVVVSDMRMPGMDGARFLAEAAAAAPDTVRVLLTGQADLGSAILAVNEGKIFRFLTKPCPTETLKQVLEAGIAQYQLANAERELLDQTLSGAVKVLAETLKLAAPGIFSHATRVRDLVVHAAERLALPGRWQYEIVGLLSQLGCIALPQELVDRVESGSPVTEQERAEYDSHPETAYRLLAGIPRLEAVAEMIRRQRQPWKRNPPQDQFEQGARLLQVALEIDRRVTAGAALTDAIEQLSAAGKVDPRILQAWSDFRLSGQHQVIRALKVSKLALGMVLEDDIRTSSGLVILGKGEELTLILLERVRKYARTAGVAEPIRVRVQA
jgi:CheY-like chemotaxis protein